MSANTQPPWLVVQGTNSFDTGVGHGSVPVFYRNPTFNDPEDYHT